MQESEGMYQSMSKKSGKSIDEIKRLWKEAKKQTSSHFDKKISDFGSKEYSYAMGILKNMIGLKESLMDLFLSYSGDISHFLGETQISSNTPIDKTIIKKNNKKDKEEEKEEEKDKKE